MTDYRDKVDTSACYFCKTSRDIEVHHVVPRSLGGSDDVENLVAVCSGCHTKLERLYGTRFWNELGFESPQQTKRPHVECVRDGCVEPAAVRIETDYNTTMLLCAEHTSYKTEFSDDPFDVTKRFETYEVAMPNLNLNTYSSPDFLTVGPDSECDNDACQNLGHLLPGSGLFNFGGSCKLGE